MIYEINNCRVAEALSLSVLGALTLYREHPEIWKEAHLGPGPGPGPEIC